MSAMFTKEEIMAKISEVEDPEIRLGVVDLGLVYDVKIVEGKDVVIVMTLTTPGCPYGPTLIADVEKAAKEVQGVGDADVELVWDPPWDPVEMASDYAKDVLGIW
jgi:metal-sulfur cluster biosynthetic enzyme